MSTPRRTTAWIALGSNLGRRRAQLDGAVRTLAATPGVEVLRVSPWIETDPVGGPPGQPRYRNGVCEVATRWGPFELLARLQAIERTFGRIREGLPRHAPRTLDLDLLLFGSERIRSPALEVPHPRLEDRTFVLEPLAALAPRLRLAGSGLTVRERLDQLKGRR